MDPDVTRLTLLVRPRTGVGGGPERLAKLLEQWKRLTTPPTDSEMRKVFVIEHDLLAPKAGTPEGMPRVAGPGVPRVDVMIHGAALTELGAPLDECRRANVLGTQRALDMARSLAGLRRFVHFSTAYVAGTRRGVVREDDPAPHGFHNHYERTKRESEACVLASGLPFTILRPSIVVGRSDDGYAPSMKVLYSVWRAWLTGHVPRAPIDPKSWVDLVPVDYVVEATRVLMHHPEALGRTIHLCAGTDRQSPMAIMSSAARAFEVPVPPISPPWVARALLRWPARRFIPKGLLHLLEVMFWHLPYLGIRDRLFDTATADRLLAPRGVACPSYATYGERLFRWCKASVWGKRRAALDGPARQGAPRSSSSATQVGGPEAVAAVRSDEREEAACSASI
jgi:nucleoside-diphosphate-sugar epimerase